MRSASSVLAVPVLFLGACGLLDQSSRVSMQVAIVLGSGVGLQPGDFTTVAERVDLSIASGDGEQALTRALGEGEFEASFDVTVDEGDATFAVDVVSNNGTLLFTGSTTAAIEADGFAVTVVPVAVNAVLLLAPRVAVFTRTQESDSREFVARMTVHNRGSAALTWRADSLVPLPVGVRMDCVLPNTDGLRCTPDQTTAPGRSQDIDLFVDVPFGIPQPASVTLRLVSPVGTLPVAAALPVPPIGIRSPLAPRR
jgi:hypothetical protein